jgi:hypothetical protein
LLFANQQEKTMSKKMPKVKPHISYRWTLSLSKEWVCVCPIALGIGKTPASAYSSWKAMADELRGQA